MQISVYSEFKLLTTDLMYLSSHGLLESRPVIFFLRISQGVDLSYSSWVFCVLVTPTFPLYFLDHNFYPEPEKSLPGQVLLLVFVKTGMVP